MRRDTIRNEYLPELRREIDAAFDSYSRFSGDSPKRLTDAIRYSLLSPGKRLRPTLALIAAELCGGVEARKKAIPAAVALEAVHSYSLIHDDLPAMDDDDLRRGRPTCHRRFDEATAILAGDALLTFAFEALTANLSDSNVASRCVLELARAAGPCGMVGGQEDDVLWSATAARTPGAVDLIGDVVKTERADFEKRADFEEGNENKNENDEDEDEANKGARASFLFDFLRRIHRRKTGAIIIASTRLGATIGGANPAQVRRLDLFSKNLGLAFQISDDLLDATGTEEEMGKRVRKDADAGKLTYATLLGVDRSRTLLAQAVSDAKSALDPKNFRRWETEEKVAWPCFDVDSLPWNALIDLADVLAERRR